MSRRTYYLGLPLLVLLFAGCDSFTAADAPASLATAESASARSGSPVNHFETFFSATAMCGDDIGRIAFSGTIHGVDHTTTDRRGEVHRVRQFRVHGLTATNLDREGVTYTVQGGAEVLVWQTQLGQVPGVPGRSIHAGTLVFNPDGGGARVVAHHAIRYVENAQGELVVNFSDWKCSTSGR
jgi:hypothetical protein